MVNTVGFFSHVFNLFYFVNNCSFSIYCKAIPVYLEKTKLFKLLFCFRFWFDNLVKVLNVLLGFLFLSCFFFYYFWNEIFVLFLCSCSFCRLCFNKWYVQHARQTYTDFTNNNRPTKKSLKQYSFRFKTLLYCLVCVEMDVYNHHNRYNYYYDCLLPIHTVGRPP